LQVLQNMQAADGLAAQRQNMVDMVTVRASCPECCNRFNVGPCGRALNLVRAALCRMRSNDTFIVLAPGSRRVGVLPRWQQLSSPNTLVCACTRSPLRCTCHFRAFGSILPTFRRVSRRIRLVRFTITNACAFQAMPIRGMSVSRMPVVARLASAVMHQARALCFFTGFRQTVGHGVLVVGRRYIHTRRLIDWPRSAG